MKRYVGGLVVRAFLVFAFLAAGMSGAPASVVEAADQSANAAVQQVIQRSNDEQVQAIAVRDPSLMADTLTSDHYQELVQVNQDLLNSGVASIKLVRLEWGAVAVDGATATATTYETWSTTLSDGTTDQSRDRNDYSLVLDSSGAWKIKSDTHPDQGSATGRPGPSTTTPPSVLPFPGIPDDQNTSHNWSGYAATGGTYTSVTGTWTVPQFSADGSFGIDAAWVGIGGVRNRDLIQAGTQQTVSGSGSTQYEAWVEMLPRSSRPVPLRVHAGDSVTVSISEQSPDQWSIAFINNTSGQTYQSPQQYASSHSSAEWVEEAPSSGRGGLLPLDNFGSIPFTNGSAVKDGQTVTIAGSNARAITMLGDTNQPLAVPSSLSDDGASFTVARTEAPATTPARRGGGRGSLPGIPSIIPLPGD
jgi:Peptidase A4 family